MKRTLASLKELSESWRDVLLGPQRRDSEDSAPDSASWDRHEAWKTLRAEKIRTNFSYLGIVDGCSLLLCLRQFFHLLSYKQVPEQLAGIVSQKEFDALRASAFSPVCFNFSVVSLRILTKTFFVSSASGHSLWKWTERFTINKDIRVVIFAGVDALMKSISLVAMYKAMNFDDMTLGECFYMVKVATLFAAFSTYIDMKFREFYGPRYWVDKYICEQVFKALALLCFVRRPPDDFGVLPDGSYKAAVDEVARTTGFYPKHRVLVVPRGRALPPAVPHNQEQRTELDLPMATQFGFAGQSLVLFTAALLDICSPREVAGVLARELGHWEHEDPSKSYLVSSFCSLVEALTARWVWGNDDMFDVFGIRHNECRVVNVYLFTEYVLPSLLGAIYGAHNLYSYFAHYRADGYAVDIGQGPNLKQYFHKLSSRVFPMGDAWYMAFIKGQPSIVNRIKHLDSTQQTAYFDGSLWDAVKI